MVHRCQGYFSNTNIEPLAFLIKLANMEATNTAATSDSEAATANEFVDGVEDVDHWRVLEDGVPGSSMDRDHYVETSMPRYYGSFGLEDYYVSIYIRKTTPTPTPTLSETVE
ncbi:hypothetical protein B0T17DRAFT_618094 [Bombardia bombarda]|uniref:Uncharacterized protein n=1 Tax=Bombardia bombarda TaxID=252184 RepID=A0AA39WU58_9PEZI|nr:hypothetical protein B0T17DRAFT_618094 [Bombardia bombarda]